jgi:hypothetical protein
MERFGATENGPRIAKPLRNMVGTRRLELLTSTVSIEVQQPVIDSKGVNNRRNRQNRNTRRNLLPNCYQNMASGFGGRIVGDRPPFALTQHPTKQDTARNLKSIYHFLLALFTPAPSRKLVWRSRHGRSDLRESHITRIFPEYRLP